MEKYQKKVFGYCLNSLTNYELAKDASQEIFIKAYRGLSKFNFKSSFNTWLYRIAFNHCQDLLKKESIRKEDSLDEIIENGRERIEKLLFTTKDISARVEDIDLIRQVLLHVSERYRDILILREIDGLSYSELAEVLDCSIDSVKAKLKRARQDLHGKIRHIVSYLHV